MNRSRIHKVGIFLILAVVLGVVLAGCGQQAVAKSDETVCVFDGSTHGAQKLKYQLLPGSNPRHSDGNDEIVHIPTSYRFYAAFQDRSNADYGAPSYYLGYAKGNTPVQVQGTIRFRFNVDRACEWYAKHGRRNAVNGSLGFNARSNGSASANTPWVQFLNNNFGTVMNQVIRDNTLDFTWPELVYGNDPDAQSQHARPIDVTYGKFIGKLFTDRLNQSLGGNFFCGTDPSLWAASDITDVNCPPIYFDTGPIVTSDRNLMIERQKTELLRAQLQNAQQQAQIREAQVGAQKRDENTKQEVLKEKIKTAQLQAQSSVRFQECIVYAKLGLDCDGHRPNIIVDGNGTTG